MDEREAVGAHVPLSGLPADLKSRRALSFGAVARDYARYRPSPPDAAVEWLLPRPVARVVDLGAGTGGLTRLLVGRADEVVAVDPDERMRDVLTREVPAARAMDGRGEAIPVADRSADAVVASLSWHWMDPVATLREVARVLVPGGVLGVIWTGPDPDWGTFSAAQAVHTRRPGRSARRSRPAEGPLSRRMMDEVRRPTVGLEVPAGMPFEDPDHRVVPWKVAMRDDELIGLLGTFSWVLTLSDAERATLFEETRGFLAEVRGRASSDRVDVPLRAEVWRTHRLG